MCLKKIQLISPVSANNRQRALRSFTLTEIVITITIIGIMVGVIMGALLITTTSSRDVRRKEDIRGIESALALYKKESTHYPAGLVNNQVETSCGIGTWSDGNIIPPVNCDGWSAEGPLYQALLGGEKKYITTLPIDPLNGQKYFYYYLPDCCGDQLSEGDFQERCEGYNEPAGTCDPEPCGSLTCKKFCCWFRLGTKLENPAPDESSYFIVEGF